MTDLTALDTVNANTKHRKHTWLQKHCNKRVTVIIFIGGGPQLYSEQSPHKAAARLNLYYQIPKAYITTASQISRGDQTSQCWQVGFKQKNRLVKYRN